MQNNNSNKATILEIRQSESIDQLLAAMVLAQTEIGVAVADKENKFHRSKYADLASVVEAIRPAFSEQGLGFMQFPFTRPGTVERSYREEVEVDGQKRSRPLYQMRTVEVAPDCFEEHEFPVMETVPVIYVVVRTRLIHVSGEWLENDLEIPVSMGNNPAQATGIAITYAKRYAIQAIAGVPSDDDDGQGLDGHGLDNSPDRQPDRQPASAPPARGSRRPQGPARPQGNQGRLDFHCDRLRQSENLTTLRALYESAFRELEKSGTDKDLAKLEKIKDEVKGKLDPSNGTKAQDNQDVQPEDPKPEQQETEQPEKKPAANIRF